MPARKESGTNRSPLVLLELIAERGKDMLAALGVKQFDLPGEDIDILVGLTRLAAAALADLFTIVLEEH